MADSKGVITLIGRKKLCMAHSGDAELPKIVKMAWGDGGVDESGEPKATTGNEVGLYNKLLEKEIEDTPIRMRSRPPADIPAHWRPGN